VKPYAHVAKFAAGPWRSIVLRPLWLARSVSRAAGTVPRAIAGEFGSGRYAGTEVHWRTCMRFKIRRVPRFVGGGT
jgi:hypothetical protein